MRPFDLFFQRNSKINGRTNRHTFLQFYISVMGLPDNIHKEKPSFLQFKKNALPTDRPTDRPANRRTDRPSCRDARTHLKSRETRYRGNKTRSSRSWMMTLPEMLVAGGTQMRHPPTTLRSERKNGGLQ